MTDTTGAPTTPEPADAALAEHEAETKSGILTAAKAFIGAAVAGLTAAGVALTDGVVTPAEWVGIGVATFGALAAVYYVPNAKTAS